MPALLVSEFCSTSKSTRARSYLVITFSIAEAIEETLVQLSAISVFVVSAVYPPKDGTTSPPRDRIVAIDDAKVVPIGWLVLPFQSTVHDPDDGVWMNAIDRY